MQNNNKHIILNLIRLYGPLSRTTIAGMMGLSIPAVSRIISDLIDEGILHETGTEKSTGGRKQVLINLNNNYGYVICIDFGQSVFRIAAVDLNGKILYKREMHSEDLGDSNCGIQTIIKLISGIIQNQLPTVKPLAIAIGLSSIAQSGAIDKVTMPNLSGWIEFDIKSPIESNFNVPVFIDDSAHMMALYESVIPCKGRHENLVFISIGAGIGTGIIVFERLLHGNNALAGALGHIIVQEGGIPCGCGNKGCLEQYASVKAIVNCAKRNLEGGVRSCILDYAGGEIDQVNSMSIASASRDNDKLAYSILIDAGRYLGVGLSIIINLLNPERIVLGGGGVEISPVIVEEAIRTCKLRALTNSINNTIIQTCNTADAGILGASILALDELFGLNSIYDSNLFSRKYHFLRDSCSLV